MQTLTTVQPLPVFYFTYKMNQEFTYQMFTNCQHMMYFGSNRVTFDCWNVIYLSGGLIFTDKKMDHKMRKIKLLIVTIRLAFEQILNWIDFNWWTEKGALMLINAKLFHFRRNSLCLSLVCLVMLGQDMFNEIATSVTNKSKTENQIWPTLVTGRW